ncbi:MAG: GNAT family N-acetyltransferase [Anaerolineae bacterium]
MNGNVYLRSIREEDMPVIHQWWNDPDNFGATGLEHGISYDEALLLFQARPAAEPYEEWFAVCVEGIEGPVGIIVIAPRHPKENLVSIGSIIIDKQYRERSSLKRRFPQGDLKWRHKND